MMRRVILIGLVVIIGGFLLIQIVPYGRSHDNPPVVSEPNWDSPQTRELAERACFDCHSNETKWPWYSHVAPVSWLVQKDVDEGRRALNFSEWGQGGQEEEEGEEMAEVIYEGEMPIPYYLITHPEARLSAAEKTSLAQSLNAVGGGEAEHEQGARGEHEEDEHEEDEHEEDDD